MRGTPCSRGKLAPLKTLWNTGDYQRPKAMDHYHSEQVSRSRGSAPGGVWGSAPTLLCFSDRSFKCRVGRSHSTNPAKRVRAWAQSRRRWRVSSTSAHHRACVKTMWPATVAQYPIGPRSSAERKIRGFTRERNKIVHCRYGTTFLHSLHPLQTFNLQHCNTTPHLAATHRQRPAARPGHPTHRIEKPTRFWSDSTGRSQPVR
jgi:hypothetical protein